MIMHIKQHVLIVTIGLRNICSMATCYYYIANDKMGLMKAQHGINKGTAYLLNQILLVIDEYNGSNKISLTIKRNTHHTPIITHF